MSTNKIPILICSQKNDAFTVSDITKGNGALTYPVGLITADEVSMGGGVNNTDNSSYYLYIGNKYWTMSPCYFYGASVRVLSLYPDGDLRSGASVYASYGARPVLSLKSNITLTGTGTQTDPWVLSQ